MDQTGRGPLSTGCAALSAIQAAKPVFPASQSLDDVSDISAVDRSVGVLPSGNHRVGAIEQQLAGDSVCPRAAPAREIPHSSHRRLQPSREIISSLLCPTFFVCGVSYSSALSVVRRVISARQYSDQQHQSAKLTSHLIAA